MSWQLLGAYNGEGHGEGRSISRAGRSRAVVEDDAVAFERALCGAPIERLWYDFSVFFF